MKWDSFSLPFWASRFILLALVISFRLPAFAQFGPRQTVFRESVESWTGTISFTASDSGSTPSGPIPGSGGTFSAQHEVKATVNLHRDDKIGGWTGTAVGKFTVHERYTINCGTGCIVEQTTVGEGGLASDAFGKPLTFSLTLDPQTDTWSFWPISQYGTGTMTADSTCGAMKMPGQPQQQAVRFAPLNTLMRIPLPPDTFHLKGSFKVPCDPCLNSTSSPTFAYTFTYDLRPVTKELELQIDPIGYDSWRPQAGNNEDDIGNTLPVDLHLRLSDGSKPKVGAIRFVIDLVKTSKEPGIAMNFPAANKAKKTVDLKMIDKNNPKTLMLSPGEGQHAETIGGPYFDYSFTLTSYDWGGWTILKATAYLPGASSVVGHLINDDSMKEVRIPKRKADSHVADAWRDHAEGATGKDDDDSDNEPEGDGEKGDGLTLYEEYRGFIENAKHIEGKPNKKDLFIRNRIGGDAENGIFIFTEDSKLEVHKDMQDGELSDDRLVNFNHDQGAHKTEQHGVILVTDASVDGANAWEHTGVLNPGPPRNTELVKVQPASKRTEEAGTGYGNLFQGGMSAGDQMIAFDRIVAHELMHTVGVWHHGDGADYMWFTGSPHLVSPLDKNFPADAKPFFARDWVYYSDAGQLYSANPLDSTVKKMYIFTEDGKDFAQCLYKYLVGEPQRHADFYKANSDSLKALGHWSGASQIVGVRSGQHSGDEQCLMRYYFAEFYPKDGTSDTFYTRYQCENPYHLLDEPIGVQLDSSPKGSGVNDEGRTPQSRYFDAHESRGDCVHQIVVNDSANPKDRTIQQAAQ